MARGFNKVVLMGNLTRDPEIRYTAANKAYARFTVAVGRSWKGSNGELQEHTDFIPVVVWGIQAEHCERYLSKGRPVLIEGSINTRSYETPQGEKRYVTEVQAQGVTFLGGRRDEGASGSSSGSSYGEGGDRGATRSGADVGSFRDGGFQKPLPKSGADDFPLDISEYEGGDSGEEEADIPF